MSVPTSVVGEQRPVDDDIVVGQRIGVAMSREMVECYADVVRPCPSSKPHQSVALAPTVDQWVGSPSMGHESRSV